MRRNTPAVRLVSVAAAVALVALACAPEPTTPAKTDLSGVWTTNFNLFSISQLQLKLVQEPTGVVTGTWTARGGPGTAGCQATACDASGNIIGTNTVAKVNLEILGAGSYEGVLLEPTRLRGTFTVAAGFDTMTFVRASK